MKKSQIYFIMYIVLITELLVVITERDELMEKENQVKDKMVKSIAEQYKHKLILQIPNPESIVKSGVDTARIVLTPIGLVSDEEKKQVEIVVIPVGGVAGFTIAELSTKNTKEIGIFKLEKNDDGSAMFIASRPVGVVDLNFSAYCRVKRQFPSYLPDYIKEELQLEVGELKEAKSKAETFKVRVISPSSKPVDYAKPTIEF